MKFIVYIGNAGLRKYSMKRAAFFLLLFLLVSLIATPGYADDNALFKQGLNGVEVPEPVSAALFILGGIPLFLHRRNKSAINDPFSKPATVK
jgi:hypothetical protein